MLRLLHFRTISLAMVALIFSVNAQAQPAASQGKLATLKDIVIQGDAAKNAFEKHMLRFDVAERIAKACFDYAQANDFAISLHILDQFGYHIYAGRMDGQHPDNVETSQMKARTALYFREPTRVWMERSMQNSLMGLWLSQMNQFPVTGGLPIIVEDQLVGAIGVGGGTSDQDEDCARAGITAVLGPQPNLASKN